MLDSCDPIDAGADDLASRTAESTPAEAVPHEDKANATDAAQAAGGKDATEVQTELMLAIAIAAQQPAPEGEEAPPVEGATPDEAVSDEADADPSLQQTVASDTTGAPVAQPAPLPAVVPVPAAISTAGEAAVAASGAAESIPAASAVTEAKAATSLAAPAAEAADAKTVTPAGQAVEAALVASAGKENAQKAGQPLSAASETTPDDKAAAPAASTPATDAEIAAQKAASRSADAPAAAAPQRDINTSETKPVVAAAQPSPEITANSTAVPAPAVTNTVAQQAAQPPAHQPGPKDAVPVAGLAVEIAAHAQAGKNHFEIRLDPPELGRIDVRLDVDSDGQVTSHLRVERPETLDLLRRDAPALERALQQAGLKTSDSGLQFSLRDQTFSQRDQGRDTPAMAHIVVPDEKLAPVETQRHYGRLTGLGSGVDIRV